MKTALRPSRPQVAPTAGDARTLTARELAAELNKDLRRGGRALAPYRTGLAPHAAMAGLWGLGEVLSHVPYGWSYPAVSGAALAGVSLARPVLHWLRHNTPGALWARASVAVGTGWLTLAAAIGADKPTPVLLIAGGVTVSLPWWYAHRTRIAVLEAPVENEIDEQPALEQPALELEPPIDYVWDSKVVASGGPLSGSETDPWQEIDGGRTAPFWLPESGSIMPEEAVNRTQKITLMYRSKRPGEVIIEPHEDCIEGHMRVTVLDRLPLENGRLWAGPNLDPITGVMPLGLFADGKGEAKICLFRPGIGMKHLLISGGTGAGKSRLLANVIAAIEHCGAGVTWFADPQGGQSVPDWAQEGVLDRVARDMDEIKVMVRAAYEVMMSNSAYLNKLEWVDDKGRKRTGKACMEPTPDMPFLALVIDEAHMVLKDAEIAQMVALISKMGRKAGVLLVLVTQTPTQDELGGVHGGPIRDNILMGNIVVLRTKSRMTSGMLSLPFDPAKLPAKFASGADTNGIGFVVGETERPVMMRVDYDEDPYRWVESSPHTKLHRTAQEAALEIFDNPQAVLGGDDFSAPATTAFDMPELPKLPPLPQPIDPDSPMAKLLAFPSMAAPSESDRQEEGRARDRILAYLAEKGPAMRVRIINATGVSPAHAQRVLNDLVAAGELTNDGTGLYAIPGTAADATGEPGANESPGALERTQENAPPASTGTTD